MYIYDCITRVFIFTFDSNLIQIFRHSNKMQLVITL